MLPLATEFRFEGHGLGLRRLFCDTIRQAPDGGTAIALSSIRANWIAGLEGEIRLDVIDGRVVVVLDLAKLQEAALMS